MGLTRSARSAESIALRIAGKGQENAAKEEREGLRWAECKRRLECFTGCNAIMLHLPDDERAQRQRRCVIATMGDGGAFTCLGRPESPRVEAVQADARDTFKRNVS
jgi:hypothetical protein